MADYDFQSSLDISQVVQNLRNIDKAVDRTAKEAQRKFQRLGDAADRAGKGFSNFGDTGALKMGLVGGATAAVTAKLVELGAEAARAFQQFVGGAIQAASQLEVTEKVFTGIFQGNEQAATAALKRIREESRQLGIDLTETASAFLPFVSSLDELSRVGKISAALTIAQPEQGAVGARIALQEALSGNVQSLVRRFEIPKEFANRLQEALDTGGVTAFLDEFEKVLKTMGRDLDALGDTFQTALGKVDQQGQRLRVAFGQPVTVELEEQLNNLFDVLEERGPDLELIAAAFGDVLANVIDFVGSGLAEFLADLDTDAAIELAQQFFDLVNLARTLAETLGSPLDILGRMYDTAVSINPILSALGFSGEFMSDLELAVDRLDRALTAAVQLSALAKAEAARAQAEADAAAQAIGASRIVPGMRQGVIGTLSDEQQAQVEAAGQEAFNQVIAETNKLLEESTKRKEENREATQKRREEQQKSTEAGEDEADAFLAEQQRLRELNELLEAGAEAQAKIDEETEKAEIDHQRRMDDIILKAEQARLDDLEESARKRVDLARKNLREIEEIETKNEQAIEDAGTDLARNEEDIARKAARKRIEIEKERAKGIIRAEEDFQKEIVAIRKRFDQAAEEAELERDAIAFIEAVKQKDREIETAKETRTEKVNEAKSEAEERQEALREQTEQEIEDARIAHERKLEDLQTALERQLEAQRLNYEQQLEDQAIAEARQAEDRQKALDRQIEQANQANQRKLEDLQKSLAAEIEAVKAAEQAKTGIMEEEAKKRRQALQRALASAGGGGGSNTENEAPGLVPQRFDSGGVVAGPAGSPQVVIAHAGETILPTHRAPRPSAVPLPAGISSRVSQMDNRLQVGNLNIGRADDLMTRQATYNEIVATLQRLRLIR